MQQYKQKSNLQNSFKEDKKTGGVSSALRCFLVALQEMAGQARILSTKKIADIFN